MRIALTATLLLSAGAAAADPGHIAAVAGHDHWLAGVAIGIAVVLGLRGAIWGKDADASDTEEEAPDAEGADA